MSRTGARTKMMTLVLIAVMTLPQLWAARRGWGPAAHLTLLQFSIVFLTVLYLFAPLPSAQSAAGGADLTYLGFAALGLAGLVPLFWALEQMFVAYDFTIATLLAQALALVFTAALVLGSTGSLPSILDGATLTLILALYGVGLHVVTYGKLK